MLKNLELKDACYVHATCMYEH